MRRLFSFHANLHPVQFSGRRSTMAVSTPPLSTRAASAGSLLVLALGALSCSPRGLDAEATPDDQELNGLLLDGELGSLSLLNVAAPAPEVVAEPDDDPAGGGGDGGSAGAGGSFGTGGSSTGEGGSFGTGGSSTGVGGASSGGTGGLGGSFGTGGIPFDGGRPPLPRSGPLAVWTFDDCSPARTMLSDSSRAHPAFRTVPTQCTDGISGRALAFAHPKDLAYAPDQPDFTFEKGVTVAAWVNPDSLQGDQTIFRKRFIDTSSFALMIHKGQFHFVARLASGKAVSVSANAEVNAWTHVAATYDGEVLRLYINGSEVKTTHAKGTLAVGDGPLLMGNDALQRRLSGKLDTVTFDTVAMSPQDIAALTCARRPATLSVTPAASGPVAPGAHFDYRVLLTNNDTPACPPDPFGFSQQTFDPELSVSANPRVVVVAAGETVPVTVSVVASPEAEPGKRNVAFAFFSRTVTSASVEFEVAPSTGCRVLTSRELVVRDLSVVEDPIRTDAAGEGDPRSRAWTLAKLMEDMAPTPADAPDLLEDVLKTWPTAQNVNGFTVAARPLMNEAVLDQFPRTPDGKLDLSRAPVRLLAIVNRGDLRDLAQGKAGEGRFVFGVLRPDGSPMEFTIILEYNLPAKTPDDVLKWQNDFHALGTLPFPSEQYNAALQALTDRFAGRNAAPDLPNGSAMVHFRTNEIELSPFLWELRQFVLSPSTGRLVQTGVPLTPDRSFNRSAALASFINANETAIIAETHVVPDNLDGQPFLGGAIDNLISPWDAPGIVNNEARHHFSLNTCDGCHGAETNAPFLHIFPRFRGQVSPLSSFLTGTLVADPVTRQVRRFSDLARRNRDMHLLVCPNDPLPPLPVEPDAGPPPRPSRDAGVSVPADAAPRPRPPVTEFPPPLVVPPPQVPVGLARSAVESVAAEPLVPMTPEQRAAFIAKGINRRD